MSYLTDRQQKALDRATRRVENITGTSTWDWSIAYQPEIRPGRGHDLTAWAADGEHLAIQYLDPYGSGALVVSEINVLHNDADWDHFDDEGNCEHESETTE